MTTANPSDEAPRMGEAVRRRRLPHPEGAGQASGDRPAGEDSGGPEPRTSSRRRRRSVALVLTGDEPRELDARAHVELAEDAREAALARLFGGRARGGARSSSRRGGAPRRSRGWSVRPPPDRPPGAPAG